jgi:hypothetical protein
VQIVKVWRNQSRLDDRAVKPQQYLICRNFNHKISQWREELIDEFRDDRQRLLVPPEVKSLQGAWVLCKCQHLTAHAPPKTQRYCESRCSEKNALNWSLDSKPSPNLPLDRLPVLHALCTFIQAVKRFASHRNGESNTGWSAQISLLRPLRVQFMLHSNKAV